MELARLLGPDCRLEQGAAGISISGLTADSRKASPGMLFAALPGSKVDGARFIADAVARGAAAVLAGEGTAVSEPGIALIRASDPRRTLALMAARFFERQPDVAVAVTGTSGKTSVADFTRQIFTALGHPAASVGTIGIVAPDGAVYGSLTTPDPISLHQTLADLARQGVTHLAFEASSHGLDQKRLDGVRLVAAAFTNLGHDHLDYHQNMESYLDAKLRLFTELLPANGTAVVFVGDGARHGSPARAVIDACRASGRKVMTVGLGTGELSAGRSAPRLPRDLEVSYGDRRYVTTLPLIGDYQRDNALVAAGLAIAAECPPAAVLEALRGLEGVSGRLELVGCVRGAPVLVDYAHKPDGLETVLAELKGQVGEGGRLICVFGCGGDRDRAKRPMMGRIAAARADVVIVTDDNPRSEAPAAIRGEILAAAPGAVEIGDRAEAIGRAIAMARTGDVVVIAGKGHETGQIIGDRVLPFSDQDVARAAIAKEAGHG